MAADMSIELTGGELTDSEMETLLETGLECEVGDDCADEAKADEAARKAAAAAGENEIMNPVTGVLVNVDDIDSLIVGCDECKKLISELETFYRSLREIAWSKTTGDAKTRRLRGKQYQAKLEAGGRYPVQSILKEAFSVYPQFRDKYMKIGSINLQMREVGKLKSMTSDDPAFGQFKGMIEDAIAKGNDGLPTIALEHGGET